MKILVAVDTNVKIEEIAGRLINFLELYNLDNVYLDLFHSYEPPIIKGINMPSTEAEIVEDERFAQIDFMKKLRQCIETEIDEDSHHRCIVNTYLEEGDFFNKIEDQLASKKYDLLVLEPTQRDSFEKFFRKNKVKHLIEKRYEPILILPKTNEQQKEALRIVGLIKTLDSLDYIMNLPIFKQAKPERKMLLHFGEHIANHPEIDSIPTKEGLTTDKTFIEYVKNHQHKHLYIMDHQKRNGIMDFFKRSYTQNLLASGDMNLIVA